MFSWVERDIFINLGGQVWYSYHDFIQLIGQLKRVCIL